VNSSTLDGIGAPGHSVGTDLDLSLSATRVWRREAEFELKRAKDCLSGAGSPQTTLQQFRRKCGDKAEEQERLHQASLEVEKTTVAEGQLEGLRSKTVVLEEQSTGVEHSIASELKGISKLRRESIREKLRDRDLTDEILTIETLDKRRHLEASAAMKAVQGADMEAYRLKFEMGRNSVREATFLGGLRAMVEEAQVHDSFSDRKLYDAQVAVEQSRKKKSRAEELHNEAAREAHEVSMLIAAEKEGSVSDKHPEGRPGYDVRAVPNKKQKGQIHFDLPYGASSDYVRWGATYDKGGHLPLRYTSQRQAERHAAKKMRQKERRKDRARREQKQAVEESGNTTAAEQGEPGPTPARNSPGNGTMSKQAEEGSKSKTQGSAMRKESEDTDEEEAEEEAEDAGIASSEWWKIKSPAALLQFLKRVA